MKTTLLLLAYGMSTLAAPSRLMPSRREECKAVNEGDDVFTGCIKDFDGPFATACTVINGECAVDGGPTINISEVCVLEDDACQFFRQKRSGFQKLPPGVLPVGDDCSDPEIAALFPEDCRGGFPGPNSPERKRSGFQKLPPNIDSGDDCADPEIAALFPEDCQGGFPGPNFLEHKRSGSKKLPSGV